jgi:hypothetical protein
MDVVLDTAPRFSQHVLVVTGRQRRMGIPLPQPKRSFLRTMREETTMGGGEGAMTGRGVMID